MIVATAFFPVTEKPKDGQNRLRREDPNESVDRHGVVAVAYNRLRGG